MAKSKLTLPKGFKEVDGKIIHTKSKEEYTMVDTELVCVSTGEVYADESKVVAEDAPKLKKKFPSLDKYKAKIKHNQLINIELQKT